MQTTTLHIPREEYSFLAVCTKLQPVDSKRGCYWWLWLKSPRSACYFFFFDKRDMLPASNCSRRFSGYEMRHNTVTELLGQCGTSMTIKVNFRSVVVFLPELEQCTQQLKQCTQQFAHQCEGGSESVVAQLTTVYTGLENLIPLNNLGSWLSTAMWSGSCSHLTDSLQNCSTTMPRSQNPAPRGKM